MRSARTATGRTQLIYAKRLAVDEHGRVLVWTDAADTAVVPDTRPQAEAERQLHTMVLAVMALLQREQRVTYRTLRYVFGVDEACLHAVRDELCFCQLAREEGGQGLVWTGEDAPQGDPRAPRGCRTHGGAPCEGSAGNAQPRRRVLYCRCASAGGPGGGEWTPAPPLALE